MFLRYNRSIPCGQDFPRLSEFTEDRDVNAAINLRTLAIGSMERLNACGVHVRPYFKVADAEAGTLKQRLHRETSL